MSTKRLKSTPPSKLRARIFIESLDFSEPTRCWASLPAEILQFILNNLQHSFDVSQCQLTCRAWAKTASKSLYENVSLLAEKDTVLFLRTMRNNRRKLGQVVKILTLTHLGSSSRGSSKTRSAFNSLVDLCPNIQQFDLEGGSIYNFLWNELNSAMHNGKWLKLKKIPDPPHYPSMRKYSNLIMKRKAAVDTVVFWMDYPAAREKKQANYFELLHRNIKYFPNLKNIDIRLYQSRNIFDLELALDKRYPLIESVNYNTYGRYLHDREAVGIPTTMDVKDYSFIETFPNVKILKSGAMDFNDNAVKYLMHKFPQLQKLSLVEFTHQLSKFNMSITMMGEFFDFISKIRSLDIRFSYTNQLSKILDQFTQHFSNPFAKVSIIYNGDSIWTREKVVNYLRFRKQVELYESPPPKYLMYNEDRSDGLDVNFSTRDCTGADLPHLGVMAQIGDEVQDLNISLSGFSFNDDEMREIFFKSLGESVDNILESCKSLKSLSFYCMYLQDWDGERQVKNESIENVELIKCETSETTFPMISARLVALKTLKIIECKKIDPDIAYTYFDQDKEFSSKFIDMPNTSFENIHYDNGVFYKLTKGWAKLFLKVSSSSGVKYFVFDCDTVDEISEIDFTMKPYRHTNEVMHINCKSIYTFTRVHKWATIALRNQSITYNYILNCT